MLVLINFVIASFLGDLPVLLLIKTILETIKANPSNKILFPLIFF